MKGLAPGSCYRPFLRRLPALLQRWAGVTEAASSTAARFPVIAGECGGGGTEIMFSSGIFAACPPQGGRAVRAGKPNARPVFQGGCFICASRGACHAMRDGKSNIRAGRVRPAVVVWRRGRQEADLQRKKRKHGRLRFFLPPGPRLRPGAVPPPLSR